MGESRYQPIQWMRDRETGEYVAWAADDEGRSLVEVDRLPASVAAGGPGSLRDEVRGMKERTAQVRDQLPEQSSGRRVADALVDEDATAD